MATSIDAERGSPADGDARGSLSSAGIAARVVVAALIATAVFLQPLVWDGTGDLWIAKAAIYAVIGLSVNLITGHAGQISLGHQAFVGIGAFVAAFVAAKFGGYFPDPENFVPPPLLIASTNFWLGIVAAAITGAVMALVLGLVALRIRGLYLALITLAFGLMAENTVFGIRGFTGGGAGMPAPRPALFASNQAYAFLCMMMVAVFLFVDWRFLKTKAGRAVVALRNDEQVAATLGATVTGYKLLAFALAGLMAGVGGALFAHWNQLVQALDFELRTALVWVLMAVVGGLGSRAGVVIGSAFFALFDLVAGRLAGGASINIPLLGEVVVQTLTPLIGALLLLLTLTLYPGGIGQQLLPIRRWLAGGRFIEHRRHRRPRRPPRSPAPGVAPTASASTAAGTASTAGTGDAGSTEELPIPAGAGTGGSNPGPEPGKANPGSAKLGNANPGSAGSSPETEGEPGRPQEPTGPASPPRRRGRNQK